MKKINLLENPVFLELAVHKKNLRADSFFCSTLRQSVIF